MRFMLFALVVVTFVAPANASQISNMHSLVDGQSQFDRVDFGNRTAADQSVAAEGDGVPSGRAGLVTEKMRSC